MPNNTSSHRLINRSTVEDSYGIQIQNFGWPNLGPEDFLFGIFKELISKEILLSNVICSDALDSSDLLLSYSIISLA